MSDLKLNNNPVYLEKNHISSEINLNHLPASKEVPSKNLPPLTPSYKGLASVSTTPEFTATDFCVNNSSFILKIYSDKSFFIEALNKFNLKFNLDLLTEIFGSDIAYFDGGFEFYMFLKPNQIELAVKKILNTTTIWLNSDKLTITPGLLKSSDIQRFTSKRISLKKSPFLTGFSIKTEILNQNKKLAILGTIEDLQKYLKEHKGLVDTEETIFPLGRENNSAKVYNDLYKNIFSLYTQGFREMLLIKPKNQTQEWFKVLSLYQDS